MKKKDIFKTNIGSIERSDINFWSELFHKFLNNEETLKTLANHLGLDSRTIKNIFDDYGWTKNSDTHIKTKIGYLSKSDKVDWDNIYTLYQGGKNLTDLAEYLGVERKSLTSYLKKFGFILRDMSDSVKLAQNKIIETNNKKLGCDYPMQSLEVRLKSRSTVRTKYNVDNVAQCDNVKNKIYETNLERYGSKHTLQNKDILNKSKSTLMSKYGAVNYKQSLEYRQRTISKYSEIWLSRLENEGYELLEDFSGGKNFERGSLKFKKYKIRHTECGTEFQSPLQYVPCCPICYSKSKMQVKIYEFIKNLGFEVILNDRSMLGGLEIDLYIPSMNIGFEYNGLYWHRDDVVSKNYHRDKTNKCLEKGIKLYHIWSSDNIDIIESKIKQILGIVDNKYKASKLNIRLVSSEERTNFMNFNHLHGDVIPTFSYGLYDGDKLVQCISWKLNNNTMENCRLATHLNSRVDFGFSRLLKHSINYIKDNYPEVNSLVTFAYRDWTPCPYNNVYINNGFDFIKDSGVMLYYTDGRNLYNRQRYMKYKLKDIFPETYDENLTEKEILAMNGIYSIHNSGNLKYVKNI